MNRVAFVFSSAPHGTTSGREGLDMLLATSSLTENIGVFFIGDGVFQLLIEQNPRIILARDYISTFKVLPLYYNIKTFWVCSASLRTRGLSDNITMMLDITIIDPDMIYKKLTSYNTVLSF